MNQSRGSNYVIVELIKQLPILYFKKNA